MNVTYPREAMLQAKVAYLVVTSLILCSVVFFLCCHVISIYGLRPGHIYRKQNRWRIYLLLVTIWGMACSIMLGVSVWYDWNQAPGSCVLLHSFLTMLFVNLRQFSGLVLYSRATIVHEGLRLKSSNLLLLREFIWYSITIGVWMVYGWSFWINYGGKVVPEGMCMLYSRFPSVILSFAALDALLSIALLLLFFVPFTQHSRAMAGMNVDKRTSDKVRDIIRYNFRVSLFLATLDGAGLLAMTAMLMVSDGETVDPSSEHIQMWALFPPTLATFLSMIGLHTLTTSWLPKRLRAWFVRTEFSTNDLTVHENPDKEVGALFLGNIHADGKTIETQILMRHYTVPFDTLASKIIGVKKAQSIASHYLRYQWLWRLLIFVQMATLSVLCILILMGIVPSWVSWACFIDILLLQIADNSFSLSTIRLLIRTFAPAVRSVCSFALMILLFDVVNWDERCAAVAATFLGMQYFYYTDALVKESRVVFLTNIYIFGPLIPFWILVLLQGDFIYHRQNTIRVFNIVQRYEYSVYLAARDFAFVLCLLSFKDVLSIGRGKGRQYFLFLNGDVAIKVVGMGDNPKDKLQAVVHVDNEANAVNPQMEISLTPSNVKASDSFLNFFPRRSSFMGGNVWNRSGDNLNERNSQDQTPNVRFDMIELRERDSLVVSMFGDRLGGKLLQIYTEPWFRLMNEWLLGFPLALYVAAILPGFIHPKFSYLFVLSTIPFLRNFGLKSAKLMKLLMFRFDFLMEIIVVVGLIAMHVSTYMDSEKDVLGYYLIAFWLDIRTNDARCVFFHTGTRRGRRLSPFERLLFRLASFQVASSFFALPLMMFLGITKNTDLYTGFKFVQDGKSYPEDLNVVLLYEFGANGIGIVVWKLIIDVYLDLFNRGKGVHFRYIRAPIAPRFEEPSSGAMISRSHASRMISPQTDVFAATYVDVTVTEQHSPGSNMEEIPPTLITRDRDDVKTPTTKVMEDAVDTDNRASIENRSAQPITTSVVDGEVATESRVSPEDVPAQPITTSVLESEVATEDYAPPENMPRPDQPLEDD